MKCIICGKKFETNRKERITCGSEECKRINKNNAKKAWRKANYQPSEKITKNCEFCGKEYLSYKNNASKYCKDRDCLNERVKYFEKQRISRMDDRQRKEYLTNKQTNIDRHKNEIKCFGEKVKVKCPRCKRYHEYRFEYGSIGVVYKYCIVCKRMAEIIDEDFITFDVSPELSTIIGVTK